jgi:outer membrane autotransporter protein
MNMRSISFLKSLKRLVLVLLLQVSAGSFPLAAADWQSLVQPVGTENDPFLNDPAVLNASYSAGKGPWAIGTPVTSIRTTVPQFFVRFYNPSAVVNPSGQEGGWVMRASTLRGLTASQIRDLFALPNTPTMMTLGLSTTGASFYTGLAAPIEGWGSGGGQQSQSFSGPYTTFFNGQAVMASVLWYPTMADTGNNRILGEYLVAHQPEPYSDMESVYNGLDVLYNPASSDQFNSALTSISAARFDGIATLGAFAVGLQNRAVDERIDRMLLREPSSGLWVRALRSQLRSSSEGFDGDVDGILVGVDKQLSRITRSGISLGWMQGSLDWQDGGGSARVDYCRLSAYSAVVIDNAFVQLHAGAGSTRGDTRRTVSIGTFYQRSAHGPTASPLASLSRIADGSYGGWDANIDLRGGIVASAGPLRIIPSAGLGYLFQSRGRFSETGAGSLNLDVGSAQSRTLLCHAGLRLDRAIRLEGRRTLTPYLSVGWTHENRLDGREVSASLNGWSDSFVTGVSRRASHYFDGAAGVDMGIGSNLAVHAAYSNLGIDDGNGGVVLGVGCGL